MGKKIATAGFTYRPGRLKSRAPKSMGHPANFLYLNPALQISTLDWSKCVAY